MDREDLGDNDRRTPHRQGRVQALHDGRSPTPDYRLPK
jgi:hypothetical protein